MISQYRWVLSGILFLCLGIVLFPDIAEAYGRYGHRMPETKGWRFVMIAASGVIGFGLGWFCSPQAKEFRIAASILGCFGLLAVVYSFNDALGWGVAMFLAFIAFAIGLGYWLGRAAKAFAKRPTTFGSAEWADYDHLHHHRMIGSEGFKLGQFQDEDGLYPMQYNKDRHLLTVAPTRSGKGVSTIIPNLLTYNGSALVIDPKGENAMITAPARHHVMNQEIYVVDPWMITDLPAARFNPLDWLVKGDIDITENAMLLADALIVPTGENDQFWVEEAKALLQGLILYVATEEDESGSRTLGRVRDLLLLTPEDMTALYKAMLQSPHHIVASTGARCLQKEEKLMANVIASAQAQTHFLDSARIRESLSVSDFRFEDLKTKAMTIYLVLPSDRLNAFGRWLRLLIQQAVTVNARNIATQPEKPVLFLLDEMPSLGKLTMVEQAFGLMAGYSIQLWGIVQDLSQLKRIYGDGWETFISNAGVLQYFGSRDRMTAEYFSSLCGVTTVWNFSTALARTFGSGSSPGGATTSNSTGTTETATATQRRLAYADELMRMHGSKQLLLIENLSPVSGRKTPWFEDRQLQKLGRSLKT